MALDADRYRLTEAQHQAIPATVERVEREKMADQVVILRRGPEIVYRNEQRDGEWLHAPRARALVEQERARPLTLQERRDYAAGFDRLAEALARPDRQATVAEVAAVEALRNEAKRQLAAEVFRRVDPELAVQQVPELAGALAAVAAITRKVEADGLTAAQATVVLARVRENLAKTIERGEDPAVVLRSELAKDRSRDIGR